MAFAYTLPARSSVEHPAPGARQERSRSRQNHTSVRALRGLITLALLAAAVAVPAAATAPADLGTLDPAHPVITWNGGPIHLPKGLIGPGVPFPQICKVTCERSRLAIDFPASTWQRPRDGVIIAIHHESTDDGINLYVFGPDGKRAGSATGLDATGESVFLRHPVAGVYTIYVTATEVASSAVLYQGDARLRPDPCRVGNCLMLPELVPTPPSDFHLSGLPLAPSTALGFPLPFTVGPATTRSCWLDEMLAQSAQKCLRITNEIDNVGDGPLIVRFKLTQPITHPGVDLHNEYLTGCEMQQVIERDDGSTITRDAGPCVYHIPHGHFHYLNMALFTLHSVNSDGTTGPTLRVSHKQGFCLTDVNEEGFGSTRLDGRAYWFPHCNLPAHPLKPPEWVTMGVSVGWGDVYTWDVPGQYVEVTGIRDGVYDVVSEVNPLGEILEIGGHHGGTATVRICLKGDAVTTIASTATTC